MNPEINEIPYSATWLGGNLKLQGWLQWGKRKNIVLLTHKWCEKSWDAQAEWEKFWGSGCSADGIPLLRAGSQPEATWSVECFQLHCCCLPRANVGARPGGVVESGPGQDCGKWGSSSTKRTSTQLGERRAVLQVKEQKKRSSWADLKGLGGGSRDVQGHVFGGGACGFSGHIYTWVAIWSFYLLSMQPWSDYITFSASIFSSYYSSKAISNLEKSCRYSTNFFSEPVRVGCKHDTPSPFDL